MKGIDRRCGLSSRQSLIVSAFQKPADFASQVFVLKGFLLLRRAW